MGKLEWLDKSKTVFCLSRCSNWAISKRSGKIWAEKHWKRPMWEKQILLNHMFFTSIYLKTLPLVSECVKIKTICVSVHLDVIIVPYDEKVMVTFELENHENDP